MSRGPRPLDSILVGTVHNNYPVPVYIRQTETRKTYVIYSMVVVAESKNSGIIYIRPVREWLNEICLQSWIDEGNFPPLEQGEMPQKRKERAERDRV